MTKIDPIVKRSRPFSHTAMFTIILVILAVAAGFLAGVKHSAKANAVKDALKK